MERTIAVAAAVVLASAGMTMAQYVSLNNGWKLLGTQTGMANMSAFNISNVKAVWAYDEVAQRWKAFSPDSSYQSALSVFGISPLTSLRPFEGFWVRGYGGSIDLPVAEGGGITPCQDCNNTTTTQAVNYWIEDVNITDASFNGLVLSNIAGVPAGTYHIGSNISVIFNSETNGTVSLISNDGKAISIPITVANNMLTLNMPTEMGGAANFKVLGSSNNGYVLGRVDSNLTDAMKDDEGPGAAFAILSSSAVTSAFSFPLTGYMMEIDDGNSPVKISFDGNGTMTSWDLNGSAKSLSYEMRDNNKTIVITEVIGGSGWGSTTTITMGNFVMIDNNFAVVEHNETRSTWNHYICGTGPNNCSEFNSAQHGTWQALLNATGRYLNGWMMTHETNKTGVAVSDGGEHWSVVYSDDDLKATLTSPHGEKAIFEIQPTQARIVQTWDFLGETAVLSKQRPYNLSGTVTLRKESGSTLVAPINYQ
ncbi:MAG: hypothetical protein K6347_08075 [Campylobacterales bacterium]